MQEALAHSCCLSLCRVARELSAVGLGCSPAAGKQKLWKLSAPPAWLPRKGFCDRELLKKQNRQRGPPSPHTLRLGPPWEVVLLWECLCTGGAPGWQVMGVLWSPGPEDTPRVGDVLSLPGLSPIWCSCCFLGLTKQLPLGPFSGRITKEGRTVRGSVQDASPVGLLSSVSQGLGALEAVLYSDKRAFCQDNPYPGVAADMPFVGPSIPFILIACVLEYIKLASLRCVLAWCFPVVSNTLLPGRACAYVRTQLGINAHFLHTAENNPVKPVIPILCQSYNR